MASDAEPPPNDHEDELQLALALSLSEAEAAAARPPRPASVASPRLPDDAWGVCADSLLPHELCCLARVSQGLNRAITSSRAYRYLRPFTLTGHAGAVLSVAVKPGGTIISGSADGWLKEWTVAGTQATCQDIVRQRARKIISVAALPDGRIVSGNQHSQLMLVDTTHVGGQYGFPVGTMFPDNHGRSLYSVAARQDGSVVSVGLNDGDTGNWREDGLPSLKVWDVAEGRCRRSITVLAVPICLAILPDGRVLMGCSCPRAGHIIVCDVTTNAIHYLQGVSLQQNHTGGVNAVASLPNERAVSASDDRTLKVWNHASAIRLELSNGRFALKAQCLHTLRGHRSSVLCVAGLPRDRIVSGSRDKTLRVWDVSEGGGHCLQTMRAHTGWVNCVRLLPDGRIVSGSRDKTLRVWGVIK